MLYVIRFCKVFSVICYFYLLRPYHQPALVLLWAGYLGIAFFAQTVLHELGHLCGGAATQHCFLLFRLPFFCITYDPFCDKILVRRMPRRTKITAQCIMVPRAPHHRFLLYQMGGCVFNAIGTVVFGWIYHATAGTYPLFAPFFLALCAAGVAKLTANGLPCANKQLYGNDAYIALKLCQSAQTRQDYACYLRLYQHKICNQPLPTYCPPATNADPHYDPFFASEIQAVLTQNADVR